MSARLVDSGGVLQKRGPQRTACRRHLASTFEPSSYKQEPINDGGGALCTRTISLAPTSLYVNIASECLEQRTRYRRRPFVPRVRLRLAVNATLDIKVATFKFQAPQCKTRDRRDFSFRLPSKTLSTQFRLFKSGPFLLASLCSQETDGRLMQLDP